MTKTVASHGTGRVQRTTGNVAKRYQAGVLKYKEMGYWVPDYEPKPTDVIACFRITPQDGVEPDEAAAASIGSTPSCGVMRNRQIVSVSFGT